MIPHLHKRYFVKDMDVYIMNERVKSLAVEEGAG
jgi:hypothetical protein